MNAARGLLPMARIWIILAAVGLLSSSVHAQWDHPFGPPCDSPTSAHRQAVAQAMELYDDLRGMNRQDPTDYFVLQFRLRELPVACAELSIWTLVELASLEALSFELGRAPLGFGNGDDFAPLLEKWQAWARDFLAETDFPSDGLKTQFWLGSHSNYRGGGIQVGCASYLLPVDIAMARGRDTLAELSLALNALFDPEQGHPDSAVETEDWIKLLGLSVTGVHIDDGMAEITLGGRLRGIGSCGDAILEAQILQTVFQFTDIKRARITDGETNLRQIVDMSDRLSGVERRNYVYQRDELDWLRG